ncbi:MAG: THUMP domain-containing protein [Eggerthellaceae bacterium]|nr:THUMP domain-containing protein [Eggerthellaceae bacterium]
MDFRRVVLIHYHEIGLKGHNRASFEVRLLKNLEHLLSPYPVESINRISGRLCIHLSADAEIGQARACADAASKVPGVARVSSGYTCGRDLDLIGQAAIECARDAQPFGSFKVSSRRNHTDFPINSMHVNVAIADVLCDSFPE